MRSMHLKRFAKQPVSSEEFTFRKKLKSLAAEITQKEEAGLDTEAAACG